MATGTPRRCAACGNEFSGGSRAAYCSRACKQRAHRERSNRDRNANRNADAVTVTAAGAAPIGHTGEAVALLAELDAELAANGAAVGRQLAWSAAERAVREMVACEIDRRVWLSGAYSSADDVSSRVKLATELRLTEQSIARLLKHVNTDMPAPASMTTMKAREAANARWGNANA